MRRRKSLSFPLHFRTSEKDKKHLWHLENKKKKPAEATDDPKQKMLDQLARDNQLKLALELVKYFPIKTYAP